MVFWGIKVPDDYLSDLRANCPREVEEETREALRAIGII